MDVSDDEEEGANQQERTQIVEHKIEPRKLAILPPSYASDNDPIKALEYHATHESLLLDGLPYIETFSEIQYAQAKKMIQDEMLAMQEEIQNGTMEEKDYLAHIPMPDCPRIVSEKVLNFYFLSFSL